MRGCLFLVALWLSLSVLGVCALVLTPWFWLPFALLLPALQILEVMARCPVCKSPLGDWERLGITPRPIGRAPGDCARCAQLDPTSSLGA